MDHNLPNKEVFELTWTATREYSNSW